MARIRIGISGWDYPDWRGDFYPSTLPRREQLAHVGRHFDTVEVNGTFYALSSPDTFRRWYGSVPADFVFAVKGSRYITHVKKLADVGVAVANFFASGVLELDDKLGPVLWQLPRQIQLDPDRIHAFLALLPHDTRSAAELARGHDDRVARASYGPGANHRIRHVMELRHPTLLCDRVVGIARDHGVALAFSHASAWPYTEEITAGFVYVRLHGPTDLYSSPYGADALHQWAARIERWHDGHEPDQPARITNRRPPPRKGRDVYVYLDNDAGGHAPREAALLRDLLSSHSKGPGNAVAPRG